MNYFDCVKSEESKRVADFIFKLFAFNDVFVNLHELAAGLSSLCKGWFLICMFRHQY
jgi:hypothetical protein